MLQDLGPRHLLFQRRTGTPPPTATPPGSTRLTTPPIRRPARRWTNPGGDYSSTLSGSAVDVAGSAGSVVWSSTSNPQMTADIQSWLNTPPRISAGCCKEMKARARPPSGWHGPHYAGNVSRRSRFPTRSPNRPPAWLAIAGAAGPG